MVSHPSRIGSYVVEAHLGRGAVGDVYRAWDELLRRRVVLQRLDPAMAQSPALRQRFRAAAQAAAGLEHPAIVRIHSLLTEGDAEILVMELIEGETLARRLARGGVDPALAERLAAELADALAAAHAKGVVHGSLTGSNVMVTPAGHAKILDFGLSGIAGMGGAASSAGIAAADVAARAADLAALRGLREELSAGVSAAAAKAGAPGAPLSSLAAATVPVPPDAARRRLRRGRFFVGSGVVAVGVVAGVATLVLWARRPPAIRVAVAPPQIALGAGIDGVDLLAAGLRTALLHTAASLAGVQAVPLDAVDKAAGAPVAMARALGAAEVVTSRLSCQQDGCAVSLSRVAGRDGSLLWTADLEASIARPYGLATAAETALEKAYPERSRRPGAARLAARPEDFERYLMLLRDLATDAGSGAIDRRLAAVRALRVGSPGFVEAARLEARLTALRRSRE